MISSLTARQPLAATSGRELFAEQQASIHRGTDRVFAYLMLAQWVAGVAAALWISPRTWSGALSATHFHVWAAVFLGGVISALPVFMAFRFPGRAVTRHLIAVAQMLTSALLIHLTGGRIETHFHIFGSLAFLSCYRDWRVLVTATIVVAADHGLRGYFWPQSVYGVFSGASLRFIEHAWWVVFEDIFLVVMIFQNLADMKRNAAEVQRRTAELREAVSQTAEANRRLEKVNAELQQKNSELDQFTYIASHDLQEPVRKLVSFSHLLQEDLGVELNDNAKRDLDFIVDAAHRMRDLVQALLELSRVGRAAIRRELISLEDCAGRAIEALSLVVSESNTKITRDPLPDVVGDPTMLTQLYQNLISNALKFTREDSPEIHLGAELRDDQWVLSVKDNGIGMDPQYAERIFQPFQRLHSRAEFAGTGIGLSICKKTVLRHYGDIWVESEEGVGTTFLFSLPCVETEHSAESESADSSQVESIISPVASWPSSDAVSSPGTTV